MTFKITFGFPAPDYPNPPNPLPAPRNQACGLTHYAIGTIALTAVAILRIDLECPASIAARCGRFSG